MLSILARSRRWCAFGYDVPHVKGFPVLCFPEIQRFEPLDQFAGRTCVVGRDPSANILLADPTCSRKQFSISVRTGRCQLLPLSENVPTFHNGVPLSAAVNLTHKDQITCGFTTVVYLERESNEFPSAEKTAVAGGSRKLNAFGHSGEILTDRDCDLGRAPGANGIVLDHPRVSRRHAGIRIRDGRPFVLDLGSSNGTFRNGARITGLSELHPSDRIDLGPFSFVFDGRSLVPSTREKNLRVIGRNLTRIVRDRATGQSKCILHDVSIVVEPGEFVCILGSSGSGKSTLMQALSARTPANEGSVFLNEQSLYANFQVLKQSIALVPQRDVLYEDLTLQECIAYTARLRLPADMSAQDVNQSVERAIERVGLAHRRSTPIRHLSGGQKKRAALANEAVSQPELLFLDEVTSGLDEGTDWEMMALFRHLANQGTTVICITHTVANVEEFCDKIVVMAPPGVLAYYGEPADAKEYFAIENLAELYRKLPTSPAQHWRDRYRAGADHQRYIDSPLTSAQLDQSQPVRPVHQRGRFREVAGEVSRQFLILTKRFSKLLVVDRKAVGIAAAQSGLIGIFLAMVFRKVGNPDPKQYSLLFFLGISCFWCGCNNASKEIVKERFMYRIERDVNLSVAAYLGSKTVVLAVFGVVQVALLFGIVGVFSTVPGDSFKQFMCMCVSVVVGTSVGLFLSSIAETEDQASTLVPIALIPQILLSGLIVRDLPAVPDFIAHSVISGFWIYRSMEAVILNHWPTLREAIVVLVAHVICFWSASGLTLRYRDSRASH